MIPLNKKMIALSVLSLASIVMITSASNAAQTLQAIQPGEWTQTDSTLVNGQALMPPVTSKYCLTQEQIDKNRDPNIFLKQLTSLSPSCQFEITKATASEVDFVNHCKDPRGFAGNGLGKILIINSKSTVFQYSVDGTLTLPAMPNATTPPSPHAMHSDIKVETQWVSDICEKTAAPTPPQQP
jgi:hypothetical protein